jgi:hypothetical protein
MNPRIQELYIKTLSEECSNPALVDIEKFAELIVRECATAIINDDRLNDVRSAANGCVRTIREHFGVEL